MGCPGVGVLILPEEYKWQEKHVEACAVVLIILVTALGKLASASLVATGRQISAIFNFLALLWREMATFTIYVTTSGNRKQVALAIDIHCFVIGSATIVPTFM